jgi:hypothetical protein
MIEVFKTNVNSKSVATFIVYLLQRNHPDYEVNFDLDDCDKILRVKTDSALVDVTSIVNTLKEINVWAEILADESSHAEALHFLEDLFIGPINSNKNI